MQVRLFDPSNSKFRFTPVLQETQFSIMPFFSPYEIAIKAGESHSVIRVTNLQTTAKVGTDAWGISGKAQPVLISASVSLRHPFSTASREDSVDDSTLHYGKLSKAILEAARTFQGVPQNVAKLYSHPLDKLGREDQYSSRTLWLFWEHIVRCLTANLMITDTNTGQLVRDTSCEVIDARTVKSLEIKVQLPKASLLGSGVSIGGIVLLKERCEMEAIHNEQDREALAHYDQTICLKLHGLRIPTLIGVNPNERLAKQTVIANIEVDPWIVREDLYAQLEEIVVKVSSSLLWHSKAKPI